MAVLDISKFSILDVSSKHQPLFLGAATGNIGYRIFMMVEQVLTHSNHLQASLLRRTGDDKNHRLDSAMIALSANWFRLLTTILMS